MNTPMRIYYKSDIIDNWQPGSDPLTVPGMLLNEITINRTGSFRYTFLNQKTKKNDGVFGQTDSALFQRIATFLPLQLFQVIEPDLQGKLLGATTHIVTRVRAQVFYEGDKEPTLSTAVAWDPWRQRSDPTLPGLGLVRAINVMMEDTLNALQTTLLGDQSSTSAEAHEPQQTPKGLEQPDNGFALRV